MPDCHAVQMGERRKGRRTTTTGLPKYLYGAILAVGEWKDPPDAYDYARCYYELDHFLVLSLSHDGEFGYPAVNSDAAS
jgi:hypothetical protein